MNAQHNCPKVPEIESDQTDQVTPRETEAVYWVALGKTTDMVAAIMGISNRTAKAHVENAMLKLSAVNRPHLIAKAFQVGILKMSQAGYSAITHLLGIFLVGVVLGMALFPDDERVRPRNSARSVRVVRPGVRTGTRIGRKD